jgi:hypothetical protein
LKSLKAAPLHALPFHISQVKLSIRGDQLKNALFASTACCAPRSDVGICERL